MRPAGTNSVFLLYESLTASQYSKQLGLVMNDQSLLLSGTTTWKQPTTA